MIKVKHPDDKCNKQQEEFIVKASEADKRFHELLFSFGNATYHYHSRAKEFEPNETDFQEWLEGLPENIREDMSKKGLGYCKSVLSFTRYVNEKKDIGFDEFVKDLMGDEYKEYRLLAKLEKE